MQRLAHRVYRPPAAPRVLSSAGVVESAAPSPVHVVFMHGLMGNHRNFASVCTGLSGAQSEESMKCEVNKEALKRVTVPADCDDASGCHRHLLPLAAASAARAYPCVAFDWRNHGDSAHHANMTLDGLAEDVTDFLRDYAAHARSSNTGTDLENSPAAAAAPVPLILVAHSMGALGLMHWMWTAHLRQWRDEILLGGVGSLRPASRPAVPLFCNADYRVLGAVLVDTAPAERPASFQDTKRLIRSLPSIPLQTLQTRAEVERWVLDNGPQDLCSPDNIWLLRYQLSNLAFAKGEPPTWKIGLREIIDGLDRISWRSGSESRDAILREVERVAVSKRLPTPAPPPMDEFPVFYLFGATSPYDTAPSRAAVRRLFASPCVLEMEDAGHFMFMREKRTFVATLQSMFCALEKTGGLL